MTDVATRETAPPRAERAVRLIDCDVHATPTPPMLLPYMSAPVRRSIERYGRRAPSELHLYPRAQGGGVRDDAWPDKPGHRPGSDPEMLRAQLLEEWDVDYAVLEVMGSLDCYELSDVAAAVPRAINDWLVQEWLDFDDRLVAAIVVAHDHPEVAVREIEERASDPRFVSIFMPTGAQNQLGDERYWPIYEAAAGLGLPISFHTGGYTPLLGSGPSSYYLGYHVQISCVMQSQLTSMIAGGMFARFPDLKVVLTECGLAWAASLRWALDGAWERMREDLPSLERRPSEYLRDHVWFTTQPIEEPEDPRHLLYAIEQAQLGDRLLFATDYPHWDFDSPAQALPSTLPADMRRSILCGNALDLFGLPARGEA